MLTGSAANSVSVHLTPLADLLPMLCSVTRASEHKSRLAMLDVVCLPLLVGMNDKNERWNEKLSNNKLHGHP